MKKYRNEWKYCCIDGELKLLESRLKDILELDPYTGRNGKYCVHSLYFDDYKDTCVKENEAGVAVRFKWRIRYYEDLPDKIHLERKEKYYGRCHKDSCSLTKKEFEALISGNVSEIFWKTDKELLKRFCIDIMTKRFAPKVIIDYERTAYIEPISNIRITLDQNISASYAIEEFLTGNYQKFPIQEKQQQVLEVKFDEILPSYVRNIVCSYGFRQTSFSKYYLGRKKVEEVVK